MGPFPADGPFEELVLFRASPGELVQFLHGFGNGYSGLFPFCRDVSLNLTRPYFNAGLEFADADGVAVSRFPLHPEMAGVPTFFQAIDYGSCRVSNVVRRMPSGSRLPAKRTTTSVERLGRGR